MLMQVTRSIVLIIAALFLTTISTVAGFTVSPGGYLSPLASPPLLGATGGITGSISIGNVAPLCHVPPTTSPAPPYYNQIEVVIIPSPSSGLPLTIPVSWVLIGGCIVQGTFTISLNPGSYSLTITSCYLIRAAASSLYDPICSGLPKNVLVEPRTWTQVTISITTGIY